MKRPFQWFMICLGVLLVGSVAGLFHLRLNNDIEAMLPADRRVLRSLHFLREAGLSDKVVLSISPADDRTPLTDVLPQADQLAADLKKLPLVTGVLYRPPVATFMDSLVAFCQYAPQLVAFSDDELTPYLEKQTVDSRVRRIRTRLITPGGGGALPFLRTDPFGFGSSILHTVQEISASPAYRIVPAHGHLVSKDGRHALFILETPVTVTNGKEGKSLLSAIENCIAPYAGSLNVRIISGHRHAVSNEKVIRKDIARACMIAGIGFFLLFLLGWRDPRVGIVFIIPFLAVLLAINAAALLLGSLSFFILGMGGVVAGISIDYGIHVYIAHKQGGKPAVRSIVKPVLTGALTTLSVFCSFFFSTVPGYSELACFTIISILLSLILSFVLIPNTIRRGKLPFNISENGRFSRIFQRISNPGKIQRRCIVTAWAGTLILFLCIAPRLRFNTDIQSFDGSEAEVFADEQAFQRIWSAGEQPAFLVAEGKTFDDAFSVYTRICEQAETVVGSDQLTSLKNIWKPREVRLRNLNHWRNFWTESRKKTLRDQLRTSSDELGFKADVFAPFLAWLEHPPAVETETSPGIPAPLPSLKFLMDRFVVESPEKIMLIAYLPDTPGNITALAPFCEEEAGTYLVSRASFVTALSQSIQHEISRLSAIALVLILLILVVLLRSWLRVLIAGIPVVSAVIVMLGILHLSGAGLNAAGVIATMVVIGLCVDYGVFMLYHRFDTTNSALALGVTLSALTTLIGAGALLAANHPVMRTVAIALSSGVATGYVSALFVIPALTHSGKILSAIQFRERKTPDAD